jgi:hypothetical protein
MMDNLRSYALLTHLVTADSRRPAVPRRLGQRGTPVAHAASTPPGDGYLAWMIAQLQSRPARCGSSAWLSQTILAADECGACTG